MGIGLSNVDLATAEELGIKVSNTPEAPTEAVTELTLAALLCLLRRVPEMDRAMHAGRWEKVIGKSVAGSTALIVGMGRIGQEVARLLGSLGAKVLACDPHTELDATVAEACELWAGLPRADYVLVHASGEDTIIGERELSAMKSGAYLLNAGRGGLVDEVALEKSLVEGHIAGAWLDVFSEEPYSGSLTALPQVLLTPHSGTYTTRCRLQMECGAVENLLRDLGLH